ncbi:MAG: hypothetical protein ACOC7M_02255 [Chloroflexota bacterium]
MPRSRRDEAYVGYAGAVICTLVLVAAWVLVLPRVPVGWPVLVVDGFGYMLSIVAMAGGYDQLKRAFRPFHSFLIAAGTWLLLVGGFRVALMALTAQLG